MRQRLALIEGTPRQKCLQEGSRALQELYPARRRSQRASGHVHRPQRALRRHVRELAPQLAQGVAEDVRLPLGGPVRPVS
jgi:hypothetical protein